MKNGKRGNSFHFKKTIPNIAFASPFFILHSTFFIFFLRVFVPLWPEFRIRVTAQTSALHIPASAW